MAVAAVGVSVGRSPFLCGLFVVVGSALIGTSAFAPRSAVEQLAMATTAIATVPAPVDVVVEHVPRRTRPRGAKKLASAVSLLVLLVVTTVLLSVLFVAAVVAMFLIVSSH
jgi:hypothetical protein